MPYLRRHGGAVGHGWPSSAEIAVGRSRGCHVVRPRMGRVCHVVRPRTDRGAAAGATWIFHGWVAAPPRVPRGSSADGSRRRHGCHVDRPWTDRGAAAGATWIVRGRIASPDESRRCGVAATPGHPRPLRRPTTSSQASTWTAGAFCSPASRSAARRRPRETRAQRSTRSATRSSKKRRCWERSATAASPRWSTSGAIPTARRRPNGSVDRWRRPRPDARPAATSGAVRRWVVAATNATSSLRRTPSTRSPRERTRRSASCARNSITRTATAIVSRASWWRGADAWCTCGRTARRATRIRSPRCRAGGRGAASKPLGEFLDGFRTAAAASPRTLR